MAATVFPRMGAATQYAVAVHLGGIIGTILVSILSYWVVGRLLSRYGDGGDPAAIGFWHALIRAVAVLVGATLGGAAGAFLGVFIGHFLAV